MNLSLGPLLYYWSREDTLAFYDEAANWPVARIYLGETVCSRRHLLRLPDWLELAETLRDAGKEVVLSSQTLIESESDLKALRRMVADGRFLVEANEWGAVRLLSEAGAAFVAGHTLNVYNPETLDVLAGLGARRWLPPVEMSRDSLAALLKYPPTQAVNSLPSRRGGLGRGKTEDGLGMDLPPPNLPPQAGEGCPVNNIETEVFAYGKLPLAYSARCFTARHYNLPKDDCQFRCLDHADGLTLSSREGEAFLTLNGIQTQSAGVYSLINELPSLRELGVNTLRLSPQSHHMGRVVEAFHAAISGKEVSADLARLMPGKPVDGYWHGKAGLEYAHGEETC